MATHLHVSFVYFSKKFKAVGRRALTSPVVDTANRHEAAVDHDSLILPTAENASTLECAHCGTTSTSMWRRAPGETDLLKKNPKVFCNDCGNDWVRYVALPSLVDPSKDSKKSKSKDGKIGNTTKGHTLRSMYSFSNMSFSVYFVPQPKHK